MLLRRLSTRICETSLFCLRIFRPLAGASGRRESQMIVAQASSLWVNPLIPICTKTTIFLCRVRPRPKNGCVKTPLHGLSSLKNHPPPKSFPATGMKTITFPPARSLCHSRKSFTTTPVCNKIPQRVRRPIPEERRRHGPGKNRNPLTRRIPSCPLSQRQL